MKRLIVVGLIVSSLGAPVGSRAGDGCDVLSDPIADVTTAWVLDAGTDVPRADAIDVRGLRMRLDGDHVVVALALRDIDARPPLGTHTIQHSVSWKADDRPITVAADGLGATWSFSWREGYGSEEAIDAQVDLARDVLRMRVPRSALDADGFARGVSVTSYAYTAGWWPLSADRAPNKTEIARDFDASAACAAPVSFAKDCTVLTDDVAADHPALDITGVSFTADPGNLVVGITVADLSHVTTGERWRIEWSNPRFYGRDGDGLATIEREGERVEFSYARGMDDGSTSGALDLSTNTITIELPRDELGLGEGVRLTDISVTSSEVDGTLSSRIEALPREGTAEAVISETCSGIELGACPIVTDQAGDARYAEATDEVPENYAGLDLLALGAHPRGEQVGVAARVGDLDRSDPPGANVVGWTISWRLGEQRIYAQAERSEDGTEVFRYGARSTTSDTPSGPSFAGTATTGIIDVAGDRVRIDVPRALLPPDGEHARSFGATAWGLTERSPTAAYLVWDETESRDHVSGSTCFV